MLSRKRISEKCSGNLNPMRERGLFTIDTTVRRLAHASGWDVLSREKDPHSQYQFVLLADGTVRFLRFDPDPETLRALLPTSEGKPVGPFQV